MQWTLDELSECLATPRRTLERYYASGFHPLYLRLAVAAIEARLGPIEALPTVPPQEQWATLEIPSNRRPGNLPAWMPERRDRALRLAAAALAAGLSPPAALPPCMRREKPAPAGQRRSSRKQHWPR